MAVRSSTSSTGNGFCLTRAQRVEPPYADDSYLKKGGIMFTKQLRRLELVIALLTQDIHLDRFDRGLRAVTFTRFERGGL
jgi:hypothetical protein